MDDVSQTTAAVTPIHPEEMKAAYELRIGKIVTLQASARITPAGVMTTGIAISLLALSFGYLISSLRPRDRR